MTVALSSFLANLGTAAEKDVGSGPGKVPILNASGQINPADLPSAGTDVVGAMRFATTEEALSNNPPVNEAPSAATVKGMIDHYTQVAAAASEAARGEVELRLTMRQR